MNIGVTIHIDKEMQGAFSNGIIQNAIYIVKVFKQLGHNAYLLNNVDKEIISAPYQDKVVWDVEEIPIYDWVDKFRDTNVLIFVGSVYTDGDIKIFKSLNKDNRVIHYIAGNKYVIDMEAALFDLDERKPKYSKFVDELWVLPHHWNTNSEYLRILYGLDKSKVKIIPFIWDPMFIDKYCGAFNMQEDKPLPERKIPLYLKDKHNSHKNIAVFEPNINVVKWSMVPTMIVEDYFKEGNEFNKLVLFGAKKQSRNKAWIKLMAHLDIFKADPIKINIQERMGIVSALAGFADVVVAHQWENGLNYAYLDALYLNFPLVHNSPYLKDAGYYYPDFNIEEGKLQLKNAMDQHDRYIKDYNDKTEDALTRYTVYNEEMLDLHNKLLDNAINPDTHNLSGKYNWKTNTYL